MYGTEIVSSYSDVTVNVLEKFSPSKHDILYTVERKIGRWLIFNKGVAVENVRNQGYNVIKWRHS